MSRRSGWRVELLLVALLAMLALALRLPRVHDLPRYTDEVNEVLLALRIFQGRANPLPLVGTTTYLGALWNYVLAASFAVFGPSPELPRLLMVAVGTATVVPTYLVGRAFGGVRAGVLAGVLLAVSTPHILLNSHVAWSACLAPLVVTCAAWAALRARATGDGRWLLPVGALAGLGLQIHPSTAGPMAGVLVFVVLAGSLWLRSPWPYLALVLMVGAYGNMILYNLRTGFGTLRGLEAINPAAGQAEEARGIAAFPFNLSGLVEGLARATASVVDGQPDTFAVVRTVLAALLVIAAVGFLARRGVVLPLLMLLGTLALLPWLNGSYSDLLDMRYVMGLAPVLLAAVATVLTWQGASQQEMQPDRVPLPGTAGVSPAPVPVTAPPRRHEGAYGSQVPRPVSIAAAGAGLALFALIPPLDLALQYAAADEAGCTNSASRAWTAEIRQMQRTAENLVLDEGMHRPGPRLATLLLYRLNGLDAKTETISRKYVREATEEGKTFLTVVDADDLADFAERTDLDLIPGGAEADFALYRVSSEQVEWLAEDSRPNCDRFGRA